MPIPRHPNWPLCLATTSVSPLPCLYQMRVHHSRHQALGSQLRSSTCLQIIGTILSTGRTLSIQPILGAILPSVPTPCIPNARVPTQQRRHKLVHAECHFRFCQSKNNNGVRRGLLIVHLVRIRATSPVTLDDHCILSAICGCILRFRIGPSHVSVRISLLRLWPQQV